jgi:hypothetical protein
MDRILPNITKNNLRQLFIFAAAFLIVLTSCSLKSSIKSLAGIPTNTEQGVAKNNQSLFGSTSETCLKGEITDAQVSQTSSLSANDFLPVVILTTFFFLLGFTPCKKQSHPLYGSLKIPGSLPLFLLYKKLIVYHSV